MITGIIQSIADQTGNFGFQFGLSVPNLSVPVNVGFSGTSVVNWTFSNGRIYDPKGYYCGSYLANQHVFIDGDIGNSGIDYYVNGTITAIGIPKSTGTINSLYMNTTSGNNISFNGSVALDSPSYSISNNIGFYTTSNATGSIVNLSSGVFQIFSGGCDNSNINFLNVTTGNITPGSSGIFVSSITGARAGVSYSGNYTLYTNFGNITFPINFEAFVTGMPTTAFNYTTTAFRNISGTSGVTYYDVGGISVVSVSGLNFINTPSLSVQLLYVSGSTGNFTTAWSLATGVSNNALLDYKFNGWYNSSGFSHGQLNVPNGSLFIQVGYTPYGTGITNVAQLIVSGLNNGFNINITGQS